MVSVGVRQHTKGFLWVLDNIPFEGFQGALDKVFLGALDNVAKGFLSIRQYTSFCLGIKQYTRVSRYIR